MSRRSTLALAGALAAGALVLAGCGAAQNAAGAASSAAAAAIDSKFQTEIDDALDDSEVKTKVCGLVKDNADSAYDTVITAINAKQAGAGDAIKKVVTVEQFKEYMAKKCS